MGEETHKRWWPLHRRAALGEMLNAEEQAFYQAGVHQLDAEEQALSGSVEKLKQAQQQVRESRAEYRRLQAQLEEMVVSAGDKPLPYTTLGWAKLLNVESTEPRTHLLRGGASVLEGSR